MFLHTDDHYFHPGLKLCDSGDLNSVNFLFDLCAWLGVGLHLRYRGPVSWDVLTPSCDSRFVQIGVRDTRGPFLSACFWHCLCTLHSETIPTRNS